MPNTQAQFGFQHIGYMPGYAPDMAPSRRMIQANFSTPIYFGDPVMKSSASIYVTLAGGYGTTAGSAVAGVFNGCYYVPKGQSGVAFAPWFPGSVQQDATALIIDAPGALFRVAALNTAIPATAIQNNVGYTTGAGGTTFGSGFSTYCVDFSTLTTGPVGGFTIVDMWSNRVGSTGNGVDNANPYNWVVVTFNSEAWRAGQSGAA